MLPESFNACLKFSDNRRTIVREEEKKKYIGNNVHSHIFSGYKLDDTFKQNEACDFLLIREVNQVFYFIELKGSDLIKAVDQIQNSIELTKKHLPGGAVLHGRIVPSRVNTHDLNSVRYRKLEQKLKSTGGTLLKKERLLEENV